MCIPLALLDSSFRLLSPRAGSSTLAPAQSVTLGNSRAKRRRVVNACPVYEYTYKNDEGRTRTAKTSAVAPQHGRLDHQSVQSRKSRYLVEDGVWRGLQVFQLHRRLQDCPFWESWLHTPDFHAHALVQVSGHSPDLDFFVFWSSVSPVQSSPVWSGLLCAGLAHKQRASEDFRAAERERERQ